MLDTDRRVVWVVMVLNGYFPSINVVSQVNKLGKSDSKQGFGPVVRLIGELTTANKLCWCLAHSVAERDLFHCRSCLFLNKHDRGFIKA
jgi:hypothetical protein